MKICSKCKNQKSILEFCKCSKSKDGLQSQCRECKITSVRNSPSFKHRKYVSTPESRKTKLAYFHRTKVARNISRRMRQSLKDFNKSRKWELLVEYTLSELKEHLESKFTPEMNWENYGSYWHIDHILPVSSFKIDSDVCDEFKKCWSLDNLQPLSAVDNYLKSNKY